MHRADAGAGKHGHRRFGNHRQIDAHPVALLDAPGFEDIGQLADFGVQLPVGQALVFFGIVAFPENGHLVAAGFEVAVEAVIGHIQLAAREPADEQMIGIEAVIRDPVPLPAPGDEPFGLFGPEARRVLDRLLIQGGVALSADMGLGGNLGGNVIAFGFRHGSHLLDCCGLENPPAPCRRLSREIDCRSGHRDRDGTAIAFLSPYWVAAGFGPGTRRSRRRPIPGRCRGKPAD